jgi:molybdopterin biosynthesis enzyme
MLTRYQQMRKRVEASDPLGRLIAISEGKEIVGIPTPTVQMVYDANVRLLNKLMPELKQFDIDPEGSEDDDNNNGKQSAEVLNRLAGLLTSAAASKATGVTA